LAAARRVKDHGETFCANAVWFGYDGHPVYFEWRLNQLVGLERPGKHHSMLSTSEAYDLAFQAIYGALPDCRECGCF
jgi:hypothetical protein